MDLLCWYPLAHRLQVRPVTPVLQTHWPDVWLQLLPNEPTGWQPQPAIQTPSLHIFGMVTLSPPSPPLFSFGISFRRQIAEERHVIESGDTGKLAIRNCKIFEQRKREEFNELMNRDPRTFAGFSGSDWFGRVSDVSRSAQMTIPACCLMTTIYAHSTTSIKKIMMLKISYDLIDNYRCPLNRYNSGSNLHLLAWRLQLQAEMRVHNSLLIVLALFLSILAISVSVLTPPFLCW